MIKYVVFGESVVETKCKRDVKELLEEAQCDLEVFTVPYDTLEEAEAHGFEGAVATGRKYIYSTEGQDYG
jgi:hypothetical protein